MENIKGSGFGSTWKTLVAYQKITRCKENIGVERAYGAMFYAYGGERNICPKLLPNLFEASFV